MVGTSLVGAIGEQCSARRGKLSQLGALSQRAVTVCAIYNSYEQHELLDL